MLQRLKGSQTFWAILLVLSVLFFVFAFLAPLYTDANNQSGLAQTLRVWVDGSVLQPLFQAFGSFAANSTIMDVLLSLTAAAIPFAAIYLFKMPNMRRIAIASLTYGYYQNFLRRLVNHCYVNHDHYRVLIIIPSYELIEEPDEYIRNFKRMLERKGFVLTTTNSDNKFARNAFLVERKLSPEPLPLYLDVPTTMRSLTKVLELEVNSSMGQLQNIKWARARFRQLTTYFIDEVRAQLTEEAACNVRFVFSENKAEFETMLTAEVDALEAELRAASSA